MAAEFLQSLMSVPVKSQLEQTELPTNIATLEEVENIVKSNLRTIGKMANDENAWDGYPEATDDSLGMMNLQISDIVDIIEKNFSTKVACNENILSKDSSQSTEISELLEVTSDKSQMPQSSEDLLDDITLVINNDTNLTSSQGDIAVEKEADKITKNNGQSDRNAKSNNEKVCFTPPQEVNSFKFANIGESFTTISKDDLDNSNKDPEENFNFEKDKQKWTESLLDEGNFKPLHKHPIADSRSSESAMTFKEASISNEESPGNSKSLDDMSENSLIERSCSVLPDNLLKARNKTMKTNREIKLSSQFVGDVTVDGENHDEDPVELCHLSYDENLTCSFYELQLQYDEDSELIEHGQRGRPPRTKVDKPAVPCRIEPKVSQTAMPSSFLSPHLQSPTWQHLQPMHTSVVPVPMQPHLGQVTQRFPVILHGDAYGNSRQMFLEVCPKFTHSSGSPSIISEVSSSQSDKSRKTCLSSLTEATSESKSSGPSKVASPPTFQDESLAILNQSHLSLEIDGPVRPQLRYRTTRNDQMSMGNERFNIEHMEDAQTMHVDQQEFAGLAGSNPTQSYRIDARPFVSNGQQLTGHQMSTGSTSNFTSGLPYNQPYIQPFLHDQSYLLHHHRLQGPHRPTNPRTPGQPYQVPLQNELQYNSPSSTSFSCHPQCCHHHTEQTGSVRTQPHSNTGTCSGINLLSNNNLPRPASNNGAVAYAGTSSQGNATIGFPNFPLDPLSRRMRMLVEMGSQRQTQGNCNTTAVSGATSSQHYVPVSVSSPLCEQHSGKKVELSPLTELTQHESLNQSRRETQNSHVHIPSGPTADGSVKEKSQLLSKSAQSHSSTRSNKGPDIPVPVERSSARVKLWLNNNRMFRPDLDSGTYDPSDQSLIPEPSLPHTVSQHQNAERSEWSTSAGSCEIVGLFEGKKMMMVSQQPSPKQKPKKTTVQGSNPKGSTQGQIAQNRHSVFSDVSMRSESSLSSGHPDNNKERHANNKYGLSSELQNEHFLQKPPTILIDPRVLANVNANLDNQKESTPQPEFNEILSIYPVDQLSEKQKADLAIEENMKLLQQKSLEKFMAGISASSAGSSFACSELERYLLGSDSKSSGNNQSSGFKLETFGSGNSKQPSFDATNYITPSDFESMKNSVQHGKSSLDRYLEHLRQSSNESMGCVPNMSCDNDSKPLTHIPLNDIAEVIGLNGEQNQQSSVLDSLCPPQAQSENRPKAIKRRPDGHIQASVVQTGQDTAGGISQNNPIIENGSTPGEQTTLPLSQYNRTSGIIGSGKVPVSIAELLKCNTKNPEYQRLSAYDIQSVTGPPTTLLNLMAQSSCQGANYTNFKDSDFEVIGPESTTRLSQIQANTGSPSFHTTSAAQQAQSLKPGHTQSQVGFYHTQKSGLPQDVEMQPLEQGPNFNNGFNIRTRVSQSGTMPVSSAYLASTQNSVSSDETTQAMMLMPRPSSPSSAGSLTNLMSASQFKQPQSVNLNLASSNVPSASVNRKGAGICQSFGGDSDVSMSSDTSLSSTAALQDYMKRDSQSHTNNQEHQQQSIHQQLVQEKQHFQIQQHNEQIENQSNKQQQSMSSQQQQQQYIQSLRQQQIIQHLQNQQLQQHVNSQQQQQELQTKHQMQSPLQQQQMQSHQQLQQMLSQHHSQSQQHQQYLQSQQEIQNQQHQQILLSEDRQKKELQNQQQILQNQQQKYMQSQLQQLHQRQSQEQQQLQSSQQSQFQKHQLPSQIQSPQQQQQLHSPQQQQQLQSPQQQQQLQSPQQQQQLQSPQLQQQLHSPQQQQQLQNPQQQQQLQSPQQQQQLQQPIQIPQWQQHLQSQQLQQQRQIPQLNQFQNYQLPQQAQSHQQQQQLQSQQIQSKQQQQQLQNQQIQSHQQQQQLQSQQIQSHQQQQQLLSQHLLQEIQSPQQPHQLESQQIQSPQQQQVQSQQLQQHIQSTQQQQQLQSQYLRKQIQSNQQQQMQSQQLQMQNYKQQNQEIQLQQHQDVQGLQQYQQQQQQQQLQEIQKLKLLNYPLDQFSNIGLPQTSPPFQPNHDSTEQPPGNLHTAAKPQAGATMAMSDSSFYQQQPVSMLTGIGNSPSMQSSFSMQSSKSLSFASVHPDASQHQFLNTQHKVSGTGQGQTVAHTSFNQTQKGLNLRAAPQQQPICENRNMADDDQEMKSYSESQLQQYLLQGFPTLDFVDFCQDSLPISAPVAPSLSQDKNLQSSSKPSQSVSNRDRLCDEVEKVQQQAERSREEADSDLSVFSVSSDVDMLSFQPDADGETLLHLLCDIPKEGREKFSSLSSTPGFFEALNLQNKNQETALHIAVKNEDLEVVKYLISHGADVNILCISSKIDTRNRSAHPVYRNDKVQQTALHEAVELGNTEIVKVLLSSQNVKVDARRPDSGLTPLMLALLVHQQSKRKKIIKQLIRHQASLSLHDTVQGKTPLMYAIESNDVSLVEQILQQAGAEKARSLVNARAKKDMTCLHFAAAVRLESTQKRRLLRCIIVAGGDASAKNSEGETPRDWAKTDIIEVLQNLARLSNS